MADNTEKRAGTNDKNIQGHIGTGPKHCHLWDSIPHRGDSL